MSSLSDNAAAAIGKAGGQLDVAPTSVAQDKLASVVQTANQKQARVNGMPTVADLQNFAVQGSNPRFAGRALPVHSPMEADLATLNQKELIQKYGAETAMQLLGRGLEADSNYQGRTSPHRDILGQVIDPAVDVASGLVNGIGSIPVTGLGIVDAGLDTAGIPGGTGLGVGGAQLLNSLNSWTQEHLQSGALNIARRQNAKDNAYTSDLNTAIQSEDKAAGDSDLLAGLKRIGRDTVDAVKNAGASPMMLESGVANAGGSVLAAGPVSKGVGLALKPLAGAVTKFQPLARALAVGAEGPLNPATALIEKAATPLAIGAMEGGGAYQGAVQQAKDAGATDDQANRAGLEAAAIQAPIAAATGTLVSKFEGHPFARVGVKEAIGNMGREAVEEGIQSGAGQLAQNYGVQQQANGSQDLLDGVGQQVGEGALYGSLSAGAIEAPTLAAHAPIDAANSLLNAARPALDAHAAAQRARVEAAGPLAPETIQAEATAAAAAAPDLAAQTGDAIQAGVASGATTPEQAAQHTAAVSKLFSAMNFDATTETAHEAPVIQEALASTGDRFTAFRQAALIAANPKSSAADKLAAASFLHRQMEAHQAMFSTDLQDAIASVPEGSDLHNQIQGYQQTLGKIVTNKNVQAALHAAAAVMNSPEVGASLTDTNIDTPQGQQTAQAFAERAAQDPSLVTPETVDNVTLALKHASSGKIRLTTEQQAILKAAHALVTANENRVKGYEALGENLSNQDRVSYQIQNGPMAALNSDPKAKPLKSATQHAQGVISAMQAGDTQQAALLLADLKLFAKHMQNKLGAVNQHYEQGPGPNVKFDTLAPRRKIGVGTWEKNAGEAYLHPTNVNSVRLAQRMALDATAVGQLYNGLAEAFGSKFTTPPTPLKLAQLAIDPSLEKSAKDLVKAHAQGTNTVASKVEPKVEAKIPVKDDAPVVAEKVVEPAAEAQQPSKTEAKVEEVQSRETTTAAPKSEEVNQSDSAEASSAKVDVKPVAPVESQERQSAPTEPTLIGSDSKGQNHLSRALPEAAVKRTNLRGKGEKVIEAVLDAFDSVESFLQFGGKPGDHELTPELLEGWKDYLGNLSKAKKTLEKRLQTQLDTKYSTGGVLGQALARGEKLHENLQFKVLNLVQEHVNPKTGNKTYAYDPELMQSALLAGMQWLVTATQRQGLLDEEALGRMLGVPEELITKQQLNGFNNGVTLDEAVSRLGENIVRFWGRKANPDAPEGFTKGIPEAMAKEVLEGLASTGLLDIVHLDKATGELLGKARQGSVLQVRIPSKAQLAESSIAAMPMALEQLALIEPERMRYIGKPPAKLTKTQKRNRLVELSQQQIDAARANQKIARKLNMPFVNLLSALGVERATDLFGVGKIDPEKTNLNHGESLVGQNRSVIGAFNAVKGMVEEVRNLASKAEIDPAEMEIFEDYGYSTVNRLHAQGAYNTQSSKLARHAYLPGWSVLDLSGENSEHSNNFMLGLAQALGVKIHESPISSSVDAAQNLVDDQLKPAVELLSKWLDTGHALDSSHVQTLKATLKAADIEGSDLPLAIHGLIEYARLQAIEDKSKFRTAMYVEADGIADGPSHALVHYTSGLFNQAQLDMLAKGGVFIGQPLGLTANEFFSRKGPNGELVKDVYNQTTSTLWNILAGRRGSWADMSQDPKLVGKQRNDALKVLGQHDRLFFVLGTFGLNVAVDADGQITLKRKSVKNPLTISIYGSGAKGIAGKIASEIVDALYEQKTQLLRLQEAHPDEHPGVLLFGPLGSNEVSDRDLAIKRYEDQQIALNDLFNSIAVVPQAKAPFVKKSDAAQALNADDLANFTLHPTQVESLKENVLNLYVRPMRQAIEVEVLDHVKPAIDSIQSATQIMSIFGKRAFQQLWDRAVKAKQKATPGWEEHMGFSANEIAAIHKDAAHLGAQIKLPNQTVFVGGSERSLHRPGYSRSIDGGLRTETLVAGPDQAGVKGAPFMTISPGDAQAIQNLATQKTPPKGYSAVFDGVNLALSNLMADSQKVNQAVYDAMMANPFASMVHAYQEFLANLNFDQLQTSDWVDLHRGLFGPDEHEGLANAYLAAPKTYEVPKELKAEIQDRVLAEGSELQRLGLEIQARHDVMQMIDMGVDHLAAAGSPHVVRGSVSLEGMTPNAVLKTLNQLYAKRLKALSKAAAVSQEIKADLQKAAVWDNSSKVWTLSDQALRTLAPKLNIPAEQKSLLHQMLKGLAGDGYVVVMGKREALLTYADKAGKTLREEDVKLDAQGKGANGLIVPRDRTIYLMASSSETLVHELIHAATLDKVMAFYDDPLQLPREEAEAVQRLEHMMEEWRKLGDNLEGLSPSQQIAFTDALNAVEGHLQQAQTTDTVQARAHKAYALNEFMAWNLANQDLTRVLRRTNIKNPLARVIHDILRVMRDLMFGTQSKFVPADFYSNLRFNTDVLMANPSDKDSLASRASDIALFHSPAFGSNQRLNDLQQAFRTKVVTQLRETPRVDQGGDVAKATAAAQALAKRTVAKAVTNGLAVANTFQTHGGFSMTMQEKAAFTSLVTAFATEAQMDPNALARIQELYSHVVKQLKTEDFMHDTASLDPAARYYAEQKLKAINGNLGVETDALGRSSLLPAFFALANTNDEFRSVLARMEVPKTKLHEWSSVDHAVSNFGLASLDNLAKLVSGEGRNQPHVLAALDVLTERVAEINEDGADFISQTLNPVQGAVDTLNSKLVDVMQGGTEKVLQGIDKAKTLTSNKYAQHALEAAEAMVGLLNIRAAPEVAKGIIDLADGVKLHPALRAVLNDFVGRMDGFHATHFDMIKETKTRAALRQSYREQVPGDIAKEFSRKLSKDEWNQLFHLAKTDFATLLEPGKVKAALELLKDPRKLAAEKTSTLAQLKSLDPKRAGLIQAKAEELAHFMVEGTFTSDAGLKNAYMVARLAGVPGALAANLEPSAELVKTVDRLVSLLALERTDAGAKQVLADLATTEASGLEHLSAYLMGQRRDEMSKVEASPAAQRNHFKGYAPTESAPGTRLIVASDLDHDSLIFQGFTRIKDYKGSSSEVLDGPHGYYFSKVSGKATFGQGTLQTVRQTAGGVDPGTGYSLGVPTAGMIFNPKKIQRIRAQAHRAQSDGERLMPIFDEHFEVVAYERALNPIEQQRLDPNRNLAQVVGQWRGRQVEEIEAQALNTGVIDVLKAQWDDEKATKSDLYVNLTDPNDPIQKDAVIRDALKLLPPSVMEYVEKTFGADGFMVRKNMVLDVLGERNATVGDFWTGTSRWSPQVQKTVQDAAIAALGPKAFARLTIAEKTLQNVMADARQTILVRSIVVPTANIMSGMLQLISRGVKLQRIASVPKKVAEVSSYLQHRKRQVKLEADLLVAESTNNHRQVNALKAELRTIHDANSRLSIWPLIQGHEFTAISEAGHFPEREANLYQGELVQYIEHKIEHTLHKVGLQDLSRYWLMTHDTPLFQGLQAAMNYGDFLMKAVLFDHLTQDKQLSNKDALAKITEEFGHSDRLPGRVRGALESNGLMWFYNFKLRITKSALSTLRENPLHALLAAALPAPPLVGTVGTPLNSNVLSMLFGGNLHWSLGWGMGLHSHDLLPSSQILEHVLGK